MGRTRWSDWSEWKQRCALARCSVAVRRRLSSFAHYRLRMAARRAAGRTNLFEGLEPRLPTDPECSWHLLESHALTTNTRQGKSYKEWLFARGDDRQSPDTASVEGGAALMLRDVARNYLRGECLRRGTVSLDNPVPGRHDTQLTYRDLLPDEWTPCDEVQARELSARAKREADDWFAEMSMRERAGLIARFHGIPLTHPDLLAHCACNKSLLSQLVRQQLTSLPLRLQDRYPDDEPRDRRAFGAAIVRALEITASAWAGAEGILPALLPVTQASPVQRVAEGGLA